MDLFDFDQIDRQNAERTVKYIDQMSIYRHYESSAKLGSQRSYFRTERTASFGIFERNGKILWKDQGNGDHGDVYEFVRQWYLKNKGKDMSFHEVNVAIIEDMKLLQAPDKNGRIIDINGNPLYSIKAERKEPTLIQVKDRGWTNWAYNYWIERYLISPNILELYYTGHAKEVFVTPPGKPVYLWGVSVKDDPIFYVHFPISGHVKCYRPFAKDKKKKWISNCDNDTDIQGYHQLDIKVRHPELVIFTKANKEIMFYRSLHVDAIAIHGENHYYTTDFIRHIKKYSDKQLFILDNDKAGIEAAEKMSTLYNIPWRTIKEAKNITDLWEKSPKLVDQYLTGLKLFK